MNILYLTSRFPFPPIGGDKMRFFNILKYLSVQHTISVVCFSEHKINPQIINEYKQYFAEIDIVILPKVSSYVKCLAGLFKQKPLQISYYSSGKMKKLVDRKIKEKHYDLIHVHLIRMAEYVKDYPIRKILDMTDAQSLNYLRSKSYNAGFWSLVTNAENIMVQKYEKEIWKYFNKTVVVSPVDQAYLKKIDERMNIEVAPIGVDIEKYKYHLNNHNNHKLCFIGNMRTAPNTDAAVWFSREILPLIKKEISDIEVFVIGSEPSPRVRALSKIPNVYITGKVADITQYVYDAAVSIAPMRMGAGMQFKILESMALGTPVVATSIGMGGIACIPDKELLIGDTPTDFARQVIKLIKNPHLREEISKNAYQFILKNYTWEKILEGLDKF